jgi:hypothetical protein
MVYRRQRYSRQAKKLGIPLYDLPVIDTLAKFMLAWTTGGVYTIVLNTDVGSGGLYTITSDATQGGPLTLIQTYSAGNIVIDCNNARNLYLDSHDFIIVGYNNNHRIIFRRGSANSLNLRATTAGMKGIFYYCEFNDAAGVQGVSFDNTPAGNCLIYFNHCAGSGNYQDAFGIGAYTDNGNTITMVFNHCHAENQILSGYSDGFTAHGINQFLYINDCTVTNCYNAVAIINSAGGTGVGPEVHINGLLVNDCGRLFRSISTDSPSNISITRADFSNPKTVSDRVVMPCGDLTITNSRIIDNGTGDYGIVGGTINANITIENTVIAGFTKTGVSVGVVTDGPLHLKNCTFRNSQIHVYVTASGNTCSNTIFEGALHPTYGAWLSMGSNRYTDATNTGYNIFYNNTLNFYRSGDVLKGTDLTVNPGIQTNNRVSASTSGCYGAGSAAWGTLVDMEGVVRKSPPDIGAFEFITGIKTVEVRPTGQGGDYDYLQASITGEVAANADLTSAGINRKLRILIKGLWLSADTTTVNVTGFTIDSTHYVDIVADAFNRAETSYNTKKYRNISAYQWGGQVEVRSAYTHITGLQIANSYSSAGSGLYVEATGAIIDSCFVNGGYDAAIDLNANNIVIANCIACGSTGPGINLRGGAVTYYIDNCVTVASGGFGITLGSWGTAYVQNHYSGGNTSDDYSQLVNATLNLTTCYSEDGTRSTPTATYSISTFKNVTPGAENLSLVSGSALIGVGTDLSEDTTYPFNWDITGAIRPVWSVGASEILPSAISGESVTTQVIQAQTDTGTIIATEISGTSSTAQIIQSQTDEGTVSSTEITGTSASSQIIQNETNIGLVSILGIDTQAQILQFQNNSGLVRIIGTSASSQIIQSENNSGLVRISGTSASAQIVQLENNAGLVRISGTSASAQIVQLENNAGLLLIVGTANLAQTIQSQNAVGVISTPITGTSNTAQILQSQVDVGVVGSLVFGTSNTAQIIQAQSVEGRLTIIGTSASIQIIQSEVGIGNLPIVGVSTSTQIIQSENNTGLIRIVGTSISTQIIQSENNAGIVNLIGTSNTLQIVQSENNNGLVQVQGIATTTQILQAQEAIGSIPLPVIGTSATIQLVQAQIAQGIGAIFGSSNQTQTLQYQNNIGLVQVTGLAATTQNVQEQIAAGLVIEYALYGDIIVNGEWVTLADGYISIRNQWHKIAQVYTTLDEEWVITIP